MITFCAWDCHSNQIASVCSPGFWVLSVVCDCLCVTNLTHIILCELDLFFPKEGWSELLSLSSFRPEGYLRFFPGPEFPQRTKLNWFLVIAEVWLIRWSAVEEEDLSHLLVMQPMFPKWKWGRGRGTGPKALMTLALDHVGGTRPAHFWVAGYFPAFTQFLHLKHQGLLWLWFQPIHRKEASPSAANSCTTEKP